MAGSGAIEMIKDPLLDDVVAGLEAKMDVKMKAGYLQIINAGMKLLFDQKTHGMVMQKLQAAKQAGNVPMGICKGTADLMAILYKASNRKMFIPALIPASITLMCCLFDLAEHAGMLKVNRTMIAGATKMTTVMVLRRFNISRQMLAKGIDALKAQRKDGQPDIPEEYGAFEGLPA